MKKFLINITLFSALAFFLSSCRATMVVTPMGELNMVSTRNISKSENYEALKTYAGVSSSDINNALSKSRKGYIPKKSQIFKEIMKFKGKTLNEAVDNVVKSQVGGDYLMNARLFLVLIAEKKGLLSNKHLVNYQYVLGGDVWGTKSAENDIQGFRTGDNVIFTYARELKKALNGKKNFEDGVIGKQYQGKIVGLSGTEATVKLENGSLVDIPYSLLRKIE